MGFFVCNFCMQNLRAQTRDEALGPLHWKSRILTSGHQGSPSVDFLKLYFFLSVCLEVYICILSASPSESRWLNSIKLITPAPCTFCAVILMCVTSVMNSYLASVLNLTSSVLPSLECNSDYFKMAIWLLSPGSTSFMLCPFHKHKNSWILFLLQDTLNDHLYKRLCTVS